VRAENPLRQIAKQIDFTFIRDEVAKFYGKNGHESTDPDSHTSGCIDPERMKHSSQGLLRTVFGHRATAFSKDGTGRGTQHACLKLPSAIAPIIALLFILSTFSAFAPTNIVYNPTLDEGPDGWNFGGGNLEVTGGYVRVSGSFWQDLNTVPGRDYIVKFGWKYAIPRLHWGDETYDTFTNTPAASSWQHVYRYLRATTNLTRLLFENTSSGPALDNILVGWLQEPAQIVEQPQSRSSIDGGTVSFAVLADGGPPLYYQWFFNDQPIPTATNSFLIKNNLTPGDQGGYFIVISNSANSVTSQVAQLIVDPQPTTPVIVLQPEGSTIPAGYGYTLRAVALGSAPLQYQWSMNNVEIPNATNAALVFESIQETNAGTFTVNVFNAMGSVRSLPAMLSVSQPASGGGMVQVDTRSPSAPVFDVDGYTPVVRGVCVAQLYAGPSPKVLRPVGAPYAFLAAPFRGMLLGSRQVPDVPPGNLAYGQLRVWESAGGSSYEEARARGVKFGFSEVVSVQTRDPLQVPLKLPFRSFGLRYGVPLFTTGKLEVGGLRPDGRREWILVGEPGFRYLIEKGFSENWVPLTILTNDTTRVSFVDPDQQDSSLNFYRSRILD
jgi:hypothetical protein